MANSVSFNMRYDMASSPRYRVYCVDCADLDLIVMMEQEAYKEIYKHIDCFTEHKAFFYPVTLVQKFSNSK